MSASPPTLPPLAGLETAKLDWSTNDLGETAPLSAQFDDVYFSRQDGRTETEHVFLAGNDLSNRFASWPAGRPFVIGETGFGTGLNMLCAWACFDAHAPSAARLHLVSTERYPLSREDIERALSAWPTLASRAERLVRQWPQPVAGVHRLWLDERVTLDLHFGDAAERLQLLEGEVDAWFLDGFAPSKNPDMWRPELFAAMASRSRPGATFATFTCAGIVKRGLAEAGFTWRKVPGVGRKREILTGHIAEPPTLALRGSSPWFTPPPRRAARHVAVIGAGIAGTSMARSLARRGLRVTLLDREAPGAGGSGNRQGVLYIKLAADPNDHSRFYLAGLQHTLRWLQHLDPGHELWSPCGLLQLAMTDREARRQVRFLAAHRLPQALLAGVDADTATQQAGVELDHSGLSYPAAGWVRPGALCQFLASGPGVDFRRGEVTALDVTQAGWKLSLADGEALEVDQVVIANADTANRFAPTHGLTLQVIRGQISQLTLPEGAPALYRVVCGGGYVTPALDGVLTFGATFLPNDAGTAIREDDHAANLAELEKGLPAFTRALREAGVSLDPASCQGRASVRAASPDKSPYAGPVPDVAAWRKDYAVLAKDATLRPAVAGRHHPGLWISAAHGARGMASAPLCAELIASRICDEPLPLEWPLVDHLHPGRRVLRDLARGK
ncbi:bifunctional tRNA (5-methylaminomethyl-2-thiouridine)(34)-methyltransferase MnmD/FAD-dependent 5-carboxymethylaminomethyl-2-thiouridine(34) oxidoreductase MnmC [Billgrantia endophytica]|uniref:tRNA 5-methylaminomethyl-2-thiouridine biosynthesis bifunctional protein MnmC n=1 Tax=Billgrantia endophytica TaxID=2033802 RepID=A0A2N7U6L8_9GAMM|nr:bifunctional tRNA (5-methylaminomethyl-2-thiouridine)(34)-methyltransferase MnmD/FAD-dependent 5-carboxymethylaminomethyl-2-thiouridine(34) oxidoreductase MnmC [Halomonas endophytica]PMR76080.1 bifunctional tRNA (5-methylaminomethyl-2-thiouridine)(34)-methyltransferase MnmD/FAD-dependent 5-carboxymethylaminomethyl-2-thiouridine(34) oxidoreductase MnmC [Halomonas endophytica]